MYSETQRPEGRDGSLSKLNVAIGALDIAKDVCSIAPAQAAFEAASALLTIIRVRGLQSRGNGFLLTFLQDTMANEQDYVELGLNCADICTALDRGMNGKRPDDLSQSVCKAIGQLAVWVNATARCLGGFLTTNLLH